MRDNKQLLSLLKKKRISRKQISRRRISRRRISRRRRRRRRISITAGEESEANVTCGYHGNKKTSSKRANISKLCKDYICSPSSRTSFLFMWTAGFAAFGSSTSGYGYSPPSATPSCSGKRQSRARRRSLEMILVCRCAFYALTKNQSASYLYFTLNPVTSTTGLPLRMSSLFQATLMVRFSPGRRWK